MVAALAAVTLGGVWVGAAVIARHRAQAAADLAALAAARGLPAGPAGACRDADAVGAAMGVTLTTCRVDGLDVLVSVRVENPGPLGRAALASARAGPA